ncbi:AAA family ATPase [Prescottella agglutinans]|uniref:Kinase n=1 Tax=Prescottella agglutinans TaxID=1644129 RepID=A0ABT6MEU2_9NOCA|nr:AAA family ATPase [Prescottella agglutinans]MDH6282842.1 putative kinase [Prescottella agglutinans]
MTELIITRGYPGSGKSSWAQAKVAENPEEWVHLNRDDLRKSLFGVTGRGTYLQERNVTIVQHTSARNLLSNGVSVIFDDTNLRAKYTREIANLAVEVGADFQVVDFRLDADECIRRNKARADAGGRLVPEDVIRTMAKRFPIKAWQPIVPAPTLQIDLEAYVPNPDLPRAYIVDIDGTLAHKSDRDIYDYSRVGEDTLDQSVAGVVRRLEMTGASIIVMSGRDDDCRAETAAWLQDNKVRFDALYMRAAGDKRRDSIVKYELFNEHVRHSYNVLGVFDDRRQVVEMWRGIGLKCFQVQDGDF